MHIFVRFPKWMNMNRPWLLDMPGFYSQASFSINIVDFENGTHRLSYHLVGISQSQEDADEDVLVAKLATKNQCITELR